MLCSSAPLLSWSQWEALNPGVSGALRVLGHPQVFEQEGCGKLNCYRSESQLAYIMAELDPTIQ